MFKQIGDQVEPLIAAVDYAKKIFQNLGFV